MGKYVTTKQLTLEELKSVQHVVSL